MGMVVLSDAQRTSGKVNGRDENNDDDDDGGGDGYDDDDIHRNDPCAHPCK